MPLPKGLSSGGARPGDTEEGTARSLRTLKSLQQNHSRLYANPDRKLGTATASGTPRGLRDRDSKTTTSDAAKKLLSNGDFAKDFARQAKEITRRRGLTRSQRKAETKALKTRLAVQGGLIEGDAAEAAMDLSRESTRKGLTSSQRTGLASASEEILESVGAPEEDDASEYEKSLLKYFDI